MHLQRITTEYSESEDRIRLAGENSQGQTVVLWLTQRMLNRLIPHLCQWLEQNSAHRHLPHADLLQVFHQQAAQAAFAEMAAREPQTPVQPRSPKEGDLVHSVDITQTAEAVRLGFKNEAGQVLAQLGLEPLPLRQWLGIVHGRYQAAQWAMDVWPTWVAEAATASAAQPGGAGVVWQ